MGNTESKSAAGKSGDYTGESGAARAGTPGLLQQALHIPLQRWKVTAVCCALSAVIAAAIVLKFGERTWHLEGAFVYSPLALTDTQKSVFTPMSVDTHLDLIKSRKIFTTLREEFNLTIPLDVLRDRFFKVEKSRGSDKIVVTLRWPHGEDGARMVNRLMALFIDYDTLFRKEKIAEEIAARERYLQSRKKRLGEVQDEFGNALQGKDALEVKRELDELAKTSADSHKTLSDRANREKALALQILKLDQQVKDLAARLDRGETPEMPETDADKTYLDERKLLLEKLQTAQNDLALLKTEFDGKVRERAKVADGVARGFIARSQLETIDKELDSVKKKREINETTVKDKQDELRRLPHRVLSLKKADLTAQRAAVASDLTQAQALIDANKQKERELEKLLKKIEPWERQIKELDQERLRLEVEVAALQQLETNNTQEFRVETPAQASPENAYTNRFKLLVAGFGGPLVLMLGLVVGWDLRKLAGSSAAAAASLELPVLAECVRGEKKIISGSEARGLALRIRQYVPDSGATILFSSIQDGVDVDQVVWETGRFLAMRDDKVLIVDARIANSREDGLPTWIERTSPAVKAEAMMVDPVPDDEPGLTGLVQHLVFEGQDPLQYVWPTRVPSVDYFPAGGPYAVTDVLASQAMKDLFDLLAKNYTLILVVGPAATHPVDTEILAAYAHGIIVLLNGPRGSFTRDVSEFFQSLRDAEAPLLGAVTIE